MDADGGAAQALEAIASQLATQRSGWLELFFTSVGLGSAYASPGQGWGREKRIAVALTEAERQGRLAEVIHRAKARLRGDTVEAGEWPTRRIGYELDLLISELDSWTEGWRTTGIVDSLVERFNRALRALRQHDPSGAIPDPFEFGRADYSGTGNTVKEASFLRFRETVRFTRKLVPEDERRAPAQPTEAAATWHPRIREASVALFLDGHFGSAVLEAFKAIETRVRDLAGGEGNSNLGQVFDEREPVLRINELASRSDIDMQRGYKFLFMGAMAGIRNPLAHEQSAPLEPHEATELLGLASLLMRRLDDAERVQANRRPGERAGSPASSESGPTQA